NLKFSKALRANQTPWEAKLWLHLRGHRFNGLKFKRQVPVGDYIADFCCDEKKLVIELDGGQHSEARVSLADTEKENYIRKEGYTIVRFWNNEVDSNLDGVLETIRRTTSLQASPHAWGEG
ncbi:MAG: endonuclease domain-containing protein, partial [bacterium]|nr:endonuclease domain-containing protein [bacterium]